MALTRSTIITQFKRLEMILVYVRDALMVTFMDIPVESFCELQGNLPFSIEDRIKMLNQLLDMIKPDTIKAIEDYILDSGDRELAEKVCMMDLLVWQLTVLSLRYPDICKQVHLMNLITCDVLQFIYTLKRNILNKNFFDFNVRNLEEINGLIQLSKYEKLRVDSNIYLGWKGLENAAASCDQIICKNTIVGESFELKSPVNINALYKYLVGYSIKSGKYRGKSVVGSSVSLDSFSLAVYTGDYGCLVENCILDKIFCFICHFSASYISDTMAYRIIAATSLHTKLKNLQSYNIDKDFAEGLKRCIPLIKFNNV